MASGILRKIRNQNHHTADIYAGAHVQNRRNISELANPLQSVAAKILCRLVHQADTGSCLCGTSGSNNDDIISDQLLHQSDVSAVRSYLRVIASYHSNRAADNTGSNAVYQRLQCAGLIYLRVGYGIQLLLDSFYRISDCSFGLQLRDMNQLRFSVLEIQNCCLNNLFCLFRCCSNAEFDVIGIRHAADRRSCDELGVEALGQRSESRKDTLNIYDNSLAGTGQNNVLLLQEVSCHRNATAHCNLIRGTADTGNGNALCTLFLGKSDHLRILRVIADQLGK